MMNHSEKLYIP